nr:uncharacterized protein LOC109151045 isoform X2 [Ipomoea batatas]
MNSIGTCAYIVLQLFQLSPQDPPYYILFNRAEEGYEGILQEDHVDDC